MGNGRLVDNDRLESNFTEGEIIRDDTEMVSFIFQDRYDDCDINVEVSHHVLSTYANKHLNLSLCLTCGFCRRSILKIF